MREPIKNHTLRFDESREHVKYAMDGIERRLLRAALEFARHNLTAFRATYAEAINFGEPATTRNELEELSQIIRDTRYLLLLPLEEERAP